MNTQSRSISHVAMNSVLLRDYARAIAGTDNLPKGDFKPVLLGLYGEVGSILATAKKIDREGKVYVGFHDAVREEFGDALWYFATLCRRLKVSIEDIFAKAVDSSNFEKTWAASDTAFGPISCVSSLKKRPITHDAFLNLGMAVEPILRMGPSRSDKIAALSQFATRYLIALHTSEVPFSHVVHDNIAKTRGRFLNPNFSTLPTFDVHLDEEERIPSHFEIAITQRKSGQSYLQYNGVFIGDPLTDNIRDSDGYRFHDVFHFAHAAILHWSPTFRALIKHKRKSNKRTDEGEDGGRAIVVEEGLTAWVFARAKKLKYFEGQKRVTFDLLKDVGQFVQGYEVERCPLSLWERAILQGYTVFLKVKKNNGGLVVCDRNTRSINYRPLPTKAQK